MSDRDQTLRLDVQVAATERGQGFTTYDLNYASPLGGRVPAFLVVPDGSGPFAGLIFVHPGQGSRATFRAEAESLAPSGVVYLTIDAPFLRPGYPRPDGPVRIRDAATAEAAPRVAGRCRSGAHRVRRAQPRGHLRRPARGGGTPHQGLRPDGRLPQRHRCLAP